MTETSPRALREDPLFRQLVRLKTRLSWGLAALMLVLFFGYLGVVAFVPEFIGAPFRDGGTLTNGIVYGLAVVVCAIAFTGFYVAVANGNIDRLAAELRRKVGA